MKTITFLSVWGAVGLVSYEFLRMGHPVMAFALVFVLLLGTKVG